MMGQKSQQRKHKVKMCFSLLFLFFFMYWSFVLQFKVIKIALRSYSLEKVENEQPKPLKNNANV